MMQKVIWYVSKYVSPPGPASVGPGGRGYLLMKKIAELGHKPVIITSDSNPLAYVPDLERTYVHKSNDGIELLWVRTFKYQVAKSIRRVISWLDFELKLLFMPIGKLPPPDAIIVSSLSLFTILNGFRWRRRFACKLVFEIRDIWPLTVVEEGGYDRWNPMVMFMGWVERLGYKKADLIVGTMPNLAEHVEEVIGAKRPTACIPMGIEAAKERVRQDPGVSQEWASQYLPSNKFIVAHAGTIGITNALHTFLECARKKADDPAVHFLIMGEGDLKAGYEAQFGHLPNLTFAPRVAKTEVASVLAHCDLLYFAVHESKVWKYGQSLNKVIDYMLSGKPIVASYSGFPSMINEAECGSFVPSGDVDALNREIDRVKAIPKPDRDAIGARGRHWILENRDYNVLAQRYIDFIFEGTT